VLDFQPEIMHKLVGYCQFDNDPETSPIPLISESFAVDEPEKSPEAIHSHSGKWPVLSIKDELYQSDARVQNPPPIRTSANVTLVVVSEWNFCKAPGEREKWDKR
jgi:hypothetical protein